MLAGQWARFTVEQRLEDEVISFYSQPPAAAAATATTAAAAATEATAATATTAAEATGTSATL